MVIALSNVFGGKADMTSALLAVAGHYHLVVHLAEFSPTTTYRVHTD